MNYFAAWRLGEKRIFTAEGLSAADKGAEGAEKKLKLRWVCGSVDKHGGGNGAAGDKISGVF